MNRTRGTWRNARAKCVCSPPCGAVAVQTDSRGCARQAEGRGRCAPRTHSPPRQSVPVQHAFGLLPQLSPGLPHTARAASLSPCFCPHVAHTARQPPRSAQPRMHAYIAAGQGVGTMRGARKQEPPMHAKPSQQGSSPAPHVSVSFWQASAPSHLFCSCVRHLVTPNVRP